MSDLFATAVEAPEPVAEVVVLHPDGVVLRSEELHGHPVHWVALRRDGRTRSEMMFTHEQLGELHTRAGVVLGRDR